MRLQLTTDPRQKHNMQVFKFAHNLHKSKRHVMGYFIDTPYTLSDGKELLYQFSVYIRQGETVVAFANGIAFDFETFFHDDYYYELGKRCECFGDIFNTEFDMIDTHLEESFGIDKEQFNEIKTKNPGFGIDNGFVLIESIFVHPFYRKKGYATTLIKAIKKNYSRNICFALSEQPFRVNDLEALKIKDRKIDVGTLRGLTERIKSNRICDKNSDFIGKTFCLNSATVELFTNIDYGDVGFYCILSNYVASKSR